MDESVQTKPNYRGEHPSFDSLLSLNARSDRIEDVPCHTPGKLRASNNKTTSIAHFSDFGKKGKIT